MRTNLHPLYKDQSLGVRFFIVEFKGEAVRRNPLRGTIGEQAFDHEDVVGWRSSLKPNKFGERGRNRTFNLLIKELTGS
jgi:hypothetical protein